MRPRSKRIPLIVLTSVWVTGIYLLSRLFFVKQQNAHYVTMEGMLIGIILIALYQQKLLVLWAYKYRLWLNAFMIGLGCLLLGMADAILLGVPSKILLRLALDFAGGFTFGLFLVLFEWRLHVKRRKTNPYSGNEIPAFESKASRFNFDQSYTGGRVFLLSNRLVFLSAGSTGQKVLFSEIIRMEPDRLAGFPFKLIFFLKDAESLSISLSMPYFWKKKITQAINL